MRSFLFLAVTSGAFSFAHAADLDSTIATKIETVFSNPALEGSSFGICFARADSGEVIYAHNARKLLAPASNTKLVSAAGALLTLGKDCRLETRIVATGPVAAGALHGDLVLVAAGDPNLSQRFVGGDRLLFQNKDHSYSGFYDAKLVDGDPLAVIKRLARDVAASGVREIRGDVVVDDGLFTETEDEFVGAVSAFCLNDNLLDVVVEPASSTGLPATIRHQPEGSLVEVKSYARTVEAGKQSKLELFATRGPLSFELHGEIALDSKPILRAASFSDPAKAGAIFLEDALRAQGIILRGQPARRRFGPSGYEKCAILARHTSPPLAESLKVILKVSQNLHATLLPPLVGALRGGGGDREHGFGAMEQAFRGAGLPTSSVILGSGSGGSRADRLTPEWTVALLRRIALGPELTVFWEALPVGGLDGTLEDAFADKEFGARVHAKTGTLVYRGSFGARWVFGAKSLSGYLDLRKSTNGAPAPSETIVFSIIIANTICEDRSRGSQLLFAAQEDILRAVDGALSKTTDGLNP